MDEKNIFGDDDDRNVEVDPEDVCREIESDKAAGVSEQNEITGDDPQIANYTDIFSEVDDANVPTTEKSDGCAQDGSMEDGFEEETTEKADPKPVYAVAINKKLQNFLVTAIIALVILLVIFLGYLAYTLIPGTMLDFGLFSGKTSVSDSSDSGTGTDDRPVSSAGVTIVDPPQDAQGLSAEEVYEKVSPSVVGVVVYDSSATLLSDPKGQGSGIIVSQDGYIVTNSHVIFDSKQSNVKIILSDEEEFPGKIIGLDVKTDLAVIKAEKTGLPAASFGNSDKVKIGQWALAIGNPMGLTNSLTRGTISAINRSLKSAQHLVKYIQTDAPINPGNSGGPLLNMLGQVIGINSTKAVGDVIEGVGFAIPSNTVEVVVNDLISIGYVSGRVKLGVTGKMISNYDAQRIGVPIGMVVAEISGDSDLGKKGVQVGDIVTKINDIDVLNMEVLYNELAKGSAGKVIKLSIYRLATNKAKSTTFDVEVMLLEDKGN
jgi:serine protease Do